jgi:peptidoglycan/xylan/chitin deacetylase (PgdA/CDA1 family)
VYQVATHDPVVFVTIDDGFTRDPNVVDFVRTHQWPVSAFIIGSVAHQAPGYFRALQSAGATIEDHTDNHPDLPKLSADQQRAEICGPRNTYGTLVGATPTLLRPPYGNYDDTTRHAAAQCGIATMVLWNATMQDGNLQIVGRSTFRAGDIVLLHFRPSLLHDLQTLSTMFAAAHLRVVRLEDYVG